MEYGALPRDFGGFIFRNQAAANPLRDDRKHEQIHGRDLWHMIAQKAPCPFRDFPPERREARRQANPAPLSARSSFFQVQVPA
jgi:hypothetical protein